MLLPAQRLQQHLAQTLDACYVLTGNEPLAQRESLDAIRRAVRSRGETERTSLTADRYFKWQELGALSQAGALFSSYKLLEISIPSGKPGAEGGRALEALVRQPPPDTCIVLILPEIDWREQKSAWYQALEKHCTVLVLKEVAPAQLPQWIAERLAQQQQQTEREALEFIARQVEGNLLAAHQEIQKLGLLHPPGRLSLDDVRAAVLNVARHDAFQLGEAVLAGDGVRAQRILQGLYDEGTSAVAIMGPLLWLLRPLIRVKLAQARGESTATALQQIKMGQRQRALLQQALERLSLRQLQAGLRKLAEIDKMAKGLSTGDAQPEISRLCFGLARAGRHGRRN